MPDALGQLLAPEPSQRGSGSAVDKQHSIEDVPDASKFRATKFGYTVGFGAIT
jgi:hypothetical protein